MFDQLIYLIDHIIDHACLLFHEFRFLSDVFYDLISEDSFRNFQSLSQVFDALVELLQIDCLSEFYLQLLSFVR